MLLHSAMEIILIGLIYKLFLESETLKFVQIFTLHFGVEVRNYIGAHMCLHFENVSKQHYVSKYAF